MFESVEGKFNAMKAAFDELCAFVGENPRTQARLDALHGGLRSKEVRTQAAFSERLASIVGQEAVETAQLVVAGAAQGLPFGWIECTDPASSEPFYYNARTKESAWERPGQGGGSVSALDA